MRWRCKVTLTWAMLGGCVGLGVVGPGGDAGPGDDASATDDAPDPADGPPTDGAGPGDAPAPGQDAAAPGTAPDPTLLPVATTAQAPLTAAYDALDVPSLAAGDSYLDPTTGVKIYKITSATYPASSSAWTHDYSEGGDEVSLPYDGETRAVLVHQGGAGWWLVDLTPGAGVSNARALTGTLAPWMDLSFTFSNNPATPHYAYVSSGGGTIRRIDIRTMSEAPGDGWPVDDMGNPSAYEYPMWLHQSEDDGFFTWMRGANGSTVVGYEPATGTKKTVDNARIRTFTGHSGAALNEPRIDRAGRYVGISMTTPQNQLVVWDWQTDSIVWATATGKYGDISDLPWAHIGSLRHRWASVDWNVTFPGPYIVCLPDVPASEQSIGGPSNGGGYGNGNWIQHPASGDLSDQWALFSTYGKLAPTTPGALAPGGLLLITLREGGERRLLAHPYNTATDYGRYSFPKFSPDGHFVMLTSDMHGSSRSDVFLAELPRQ